MRSGAAAGLGRIGRDVLDPQMRERAPDLGEMLAIDLAAGFGRMEIVAAPIRVETARQSARRKRLHKPTEGRIGSLLFDQDGGIDLVRCVIHCHDQVQRRRAGEPRRAGAVLVQHHPRIRLALTFAPVRTAFARALDKSRLLQLRLRPAVAPRKPMMAPQPVVKMPNVPTLIHLPVQIQHPPPIALWNPTRGGLPKTPIQQAGLALILVASPIATELPLRHPQQLRSLHRRQFRRLPTTQHVPKLQHPAFL